MSTTDQIDVICSDVFNIMKKYEHLFPVIKMVKQNIESDILAQHFLEWYCGLRSICASKNNASQILWWTASQDAFKILKASVIRAVLGEYTRLTDSKDWNEMLKKENL